MAKAYLEKLTQLVDALEIADKGGCLMEVRHFFNGAALYVDGTICASWSPAGLAFKLPEPEVSSLIAEGTAKPLRYFPAGHIKVGYVLFEDPDVENPGLWKAYFAAAISNAVAD